MDMGNSPWGEIELQGDDEESSRKATVSSLNRVEAELYHAGRAKRQRIFACQRPLRSYSVPLFSKRQ
jgi:hypothetical protein